MKKTPRRVSITIVFLAAHVGSLDNEISDHSVPNINITVETL